MSLEVTLALDGFQAESGRNKGRNIYISPPKKDGICK